MRVEGASIGRTNRPHTHCSPLAEDPRRPPECSRERASEFCPTLRNDHRIPRTSALQRNGPKTRYAHLKASSLNGEFRPTRVLKTSAASCVGRCAAHKAHNRRQGCLWRVRLKKKQRRSMVATSPRVSPTHSPMSKPVSSIRYRCGFPGCNKRYASTDGTPAHTARESWPQRRQTHPCREAVPAPRGRPTRPGARRIVGRRRSAVSSAPGARGARVSSTL